MDHDRIYDRKLTRHLDDKYGDPVPEVEIDLIADERNEEMLDASNSGDLGKLTRLMNGTRK